MDEARLGDGVRPLRPGLRGRPVRGVGRAARPAARWPGPSGSATWWCPARHVDIEAVARDTATWSSRSPAGRRLRVDGRLRPGRAADLVGSAVPHGVPQAPPAVLLAPADGGAAPGDRGPLRRAARRLLVGRARATCDGAEEYAQHIPVRVITLLLGIPAEDGDLFRGWIHQMLERGPDRHRVGGGRAVRVRRVPRRRRSSSASTRAWATTSSRSCSRPSSTGGGSPARRSSAGACSCCWPASTPPGAPSARRSGTWPGTPTTSSACGTSPGLLPTAVEELLRAYAPVTMAREAVVDTELAGCPVRRRHAAAAAVPRRQPRPGAVRGRRRGPPRPQPEPPRGVRRGHPPVPRLAPGPPRGHRRRRAVPRPHRHVRAGRPRRRPWSTGQVRGPRHPAACRLNGTRPTRGQGRAAVGSGSVAGDGRPARSARRGRGRRPGRWRRRCLPALAVGLGPCRRGTPPRRCRRWPRTCRPSGRSCSQPPRSPGFSGLGAASWAG